MAGVLEPVCGEIVLAGHDLTADRTAALAATGYMPDFSPVYENLRASEYLDVFAAADGIAAHERKNVVDAWLCMVGLEAKAAALVRELSRGMRQRLVLAKTLLSRPRVLLLDEPASGLDPAARRQVMDLVRQATEGGAAVIISSHVLADLGEYCDAIGILERGRMVLSGTLADIRTRMTPSGKVVVGLADDEQSPACLWALLDHWQLAHTRVRAEGGLFHIDLHSDPAVRADFLRQLVMRGAAVTHFCAVQDTVEDIFFKVGAKEVA
jgi:ABC-2 type transport system ATP-binding protein